MLFRSAVLLFGANKIPKLARSSGQAIGEFQKGREELEQELDDIKNSEDPEFSGPNSGSSAESNTMTSESAETETTSTQSGTDSSGSTTE